LLLLTTIIVSVIIVTTLGALFISPWFFLLGAFILIGTVLFKKAIFENKWLLIMILMSILPGMLGRYTTEPRGGTAILLTDVLVGLFVGIWILRKIITHEKIASHILFKALSIFWIVLLLSFIQGLIIIHFTGNIELQEVIKALLYLLRYLFYIPIGIMTYETIHHEKDIHKWMLIFSHIFFWVIVGGFFQLIFFPDFFEFFVKYGWDPHKNRLLGSFFDPNFIGAFLSMNILLFLSIVIHDSKNRWWYSILIGLGFIAMGLTLSRSAYLAFLCGFVFLTFFRARFLLISGIIGISMIVIATPTIFQRISQGVSVDTSSQKHIESWHTASKLMTAYPILGVGYNHLSTVQDDLSLVDEWDVNNRGGFENSFLSVTVYSGIVGLLSFIVFWFLYFKYSIKNSFSKKNSKFIQGVSFGIASALVVSIVSSMLINTLFFTFIVVELWILLGILVWVDKKRYK